MTDFLGGWFVRDDDIAGGCRVVPVRARYEAETLNRRIANSVEDAVRYDIDIVLSGGEDLGRKFWAHRLEHDIDKRFLMPVPQDPGIVVPTASARVRTKAKAGDSELSIYSGSAKVETLMVGTLFCFSGGERLYAVVGSDDHDLPTTGSVAVSVVPKLVDDVPTTARLDFTPTVPFKHSAESDFGTTWDNVGGTVIRFTVRNDA